MILLLTLTLTLLVETSLAFSTSTRQNTLQPNINHRTVTTLDYPKLIENLSKLTSTTPGKLLLDPFQPPTAKTPLEAISLYETITEIEHLVTSNPTSPYNNLFNSHNCDISSLLKTATTTKRILEVDEVKEIASCVNLISNVGKFFLNLPRKEYPNLCEYATNSTLILHDPEFPALLSNAFEGDELSSKYFPALRQLRNQISDQQRTIASQITSIMRSDDMKNKLSDSSTSSPSFSLTNNRYTLAVKPSFKSSVGICHGRSRTTKTLYIEPYELVEPTNFLRECESELLAEEARILRMITSEIVKNRPQIDLGLAAVSMLDTLNARYLLGAKLSGKVPVVGTSKCISVKGARHPCLLLSNPNPLSVIPNDVSIGFDNNSCLILSGPNSGGKTIILKLLGLYALMAREGIMIPCSGATTPRVDFFHEIFADIGDMQGLESELSTFSGHMQFASEVLRSCDDDDDDDDANDTHSLALFDELGTGTAPQQGVSLAQAILERLVSSKKFTVCLTTHFLEIKNLASESGEGVYKIGAMSFSNDKPTYLLQMDKTGESHAFNSAEAQNVPQDVIKRARELLSSDSTLYADLSSKLQRELDQLEAEKEEIASLKADLITSKQNQTKQQHDLEQQRNNVKTETSREFRKVLQRKERDLQAILDNLTNKSNVDGGSNDKKISKLVRNAQNELVSIKSSLKHELTVPMNVLEADLSPLRSCIKLEDTKTLQVSDSLVVFNEKSPVYGKVVTVASFNRNNVNVDYGGLSLRLKPAELARVSENYVEAERETARSRKVSKRVMDEHKSSNFKASSIKSNSNSNSNLHLRVDSNTIDLRGMDFTDAQSAILDQFSQTLLSSSNVVYILHGHEAKKGSGLKSQIRVWLKKKQKNVVSFAPADRGDGGDAYTKVLLK